MIKYTIFWYNNQEKQNRFGNTKFEGYRQGEPRCRDHGRGGNFDRIIAEMIQNYNNRQGIGNGVLFL